MNKQQKKRVSLTVILFMIIHMLIAFPVLGEESGTDIEAVKRGDYGAYLLDDNEDGGASFIKWSGNDSEFGTNRVSDMENGGTRSDMVRQLKGIKQNYIVNYLIDPQDGSTSGANNKVDYSAYQYFGFWYRGDGTANTLTMIFKTNSASNAAQIDQEIPADQNWHYACYAIEGLTGSGNLSALESFNIKLANQSGVVYVDELLLTEKDPTGGGGTEPTDPPEEPEEEQEPDMDWVKTDAYLLDNNEDGENMEEFIQWLGDSNFSTNRAADENGFWVRELKKGSASYVMNALKDGSSQSSSTNLFDYSKYRYFSFWYRGDGQANTLTLAFKSAGNVTAASVVVSIPADQEWHYYSKPISEIMGSGDMSQLERFNVSLSDSSSGAVYVDDLLLSTVNPMDSEGGGEEPGPGPEQPDYEDYGQIAVVDDGEENGNRHVVWETLNGANISTAAVAELPGEMESGAAELLGETTLKFSPSAVCHYVSSSTIKDSDGDNFKAELKEGIASGKYKYFSFWYRADSNIPSGRTFKIGFRTNKAGGNHDAIGGATFTTVTLNADKGWQLAVFPISGWDTSAEIDRISVSIDPAPGVVCDLYFDFIAFSEKDPSSSGGEEPGPDEPTPPELPEGEMAVNGDADQETSFSDTFYQYRTESATIASAPKFFQWAEAGVNGAPAVRNGGTGSHYIKVMRRAEDGTATNNNQSVWYKYGGKGVTVKPGHTYRISNYVYVEGSGSVAVKHGFKFTAAPPGASTEVIFSEEKSIQQGSWQKMITDYYIPASEDDDPNAEYTLMFVPYIADCDQAGTKNVVFYLDDFSVMEVTPSFTLSGPEAVSQGSSAQYSVGKITNQWGDSMALGQMGIRYDVIGADGVLPAGVSISQDGVLTVPAETVSFRALVRASLTDQLFLEEPVIGADLTKGNVIASQTLSVEISGSVESGVNLLVSEAANYSGAEEKESEADGAPTALEGDTVFYADAQAVYQKGVTVTEGVPYQVSAYVYLPGSGSAQMRFTAGSVSTPAVEIPKGAWTLVSGSFVLPVTQSGTETQKTVTVLLNSTENDAFYFDNMSLFEIMPSIVLPDVTLIQVPGSSFAAEAFDQWGYPYDKTALKYQMKVTQGTGEGISMDPATGTIVIDQSAPSCSFVACAGISYDSGADFGSDTAQNIVALESREFHFLRQAVVEEVLAQMQNCFSAGELSDLLFAQQSEGIINAEVLGFDTAAYDALTQRGRNEVMVMLFERRAEMTDKLTAAAFFEECVTEQRILDALNQASATEIETIIRENAVVLGVDPDANPYYANPKYTAANNAALANDINAISRAAEFPELFYQIVLYSTFNAIASNDKADMHQFLTDHREELSVTDRYFNNPSYQVKYLTALCAASASSYGQLSAVINDTINKTNVSDGSSIISSGGGGGGGGGGNASLSGSKLLTSSGETSTAPVNPETEAYFDDITEDLAWARQSINRLADLGIVNGVADRTFEPDRSITREEFLKIALLAFGVGVSNAESSFSDVDAESWYAPYVAAAASLGLVEGNGDGTFGIGQVISRQDMAVMAYRIAQYAGVTLYPDELTFADSGEIADYAQESVSALAEAEIMNGVGDNRFAPYEEASRAMACKVIDLLMQKGETA